MMKQYYTFCLFCCIFCACQPNIEPQTEVLPISSKEDSLLLKPTIELDTVETELPQSEPIDSHNFYYQPNNNSKELKRFLTEPIDLPKFKKKNSANSRVKNGKDYYLKPKEKGRYYNYFLFRGCSEYRLVIDVYMYADSPDSYSKAHETLIELRCSCENADLKALDLVGKEWGILKEKYGDNYLKNGKTRIYAYKGNLLILKLWGKKIGSYRYVRTNIKQVKSIEDIPAALLK